MRASLILVLLAFALSAIGCADRPTKSEAKWTPLPATPAELAEVARIEATGREIYRQDQLAWHASDALTAADAKAPVPAGGGWVITNLANAAQVTFIVEEGPGLRIVADVTVPNEGPPSVVLNPGRRLSSAELAMFHARQTALRSAPNICGGALNSAILPAGAGEWDVFVLTSSNQPHIVPMGGHSRVRVSADGMTVIETEPYSKSCLNMDDGAKNLVALMATHIVSDLPAPTHVFLSLTYAKPIMLATRTHLWSIEKGKIVAVDKSGR